MIHFVWTGDIQAKVIGLNGAQGGKLDIKSTQVSTRDFLVKSLGQHAETCISASQLW